MRIKQLKGCCEDKLICAVVDESENSLELFELELNGTKKLSENGQVVFDNLKPDHVYKISGIVEGRELEPIFLPTHQRKHIPNYAPLPFNATGVRINDKEFKCELIDI